MSALSISHHSNLSVEEQNSFDGYTTSEFDNKREQMLEVVNLILSHGFLPPEVVQTEVTWFYNNLGIDDTYFKMESAETISKHIISLYAAKLSAFIKNSDNLKVNLEQENESGAAYIHSSKPGVSQIDGPQYEQIIDQKYLDISNRERSFRLETYRSKGNVSTSFKTQLRCYFITKCRFVVPEPAPEELLDISKVSDETFLSKASANTLQLYQKILQAVLMRSGPVIEMHEVEDSRCKKIIIGYRQETTKLFFSALSDLYHYYQLYSVRKYVENFSNGVTIICLYLVPLSLRITSMEQAILQIMKEASLIYCLPKTPLHSNFQMGTLSIQETVYGYCGMIFAQHFLNRLGNEYHTLSSFLDASNPLHVNVLIKLKKRLRQETFTREYVRDIIQCYPDLIRVLYVNFAMTHYILAQKENTLIPTLSYQRLHRDRVLSEDEIHDRIKKTVSNQHEQMVFDCLMTFNKHILRTNFYQHAKVALSFRLDPSFLPQQEYPNKPFGMFLIVGSEFRGFHVRFRDISRGGIRIIRSRNREAYSINVRSLFDENYALASTQQQKNKDIPEGGAKGTILLDIDAQDKSRIAFEKYVDAILDLILVGQIPQQDKIIDLYKKKEILFFGPDEGSADYMDWASEHAKQRGVDFWKAITTGKSQYLGGIPHDVFGMTTRSIQQYTKGIYEKFGLDPRKCTKLQTGGPDGDLGSNEIKLSLDITIGIIDGSGVLYDPDGIDKEELLKLASKRQTISNFDLKKLGSKGFRILVDESNISLPNGELVDDGLSFRNNFHFHELAKADLFVPCGGRPESVDANNVGKLIDKDNKPHFKFIVEGANLFFTQEARTRLEKVGVVIIKDSSANKGGVTSSSLEVLASLCFDDGEFSKNMQVDCGLVPRFYESYIQDVHKIIQDNAKLEFECIWNEHAFKPESAFSSISDEISMSIVKLKDDIAEAEILWNDIKLRNLVLSKSIPLILQQKIGGLDTLIKRVPDTYLRALFASYLASRFVYRFGPRAGSLALYEFLAEIKNQ